MAQNFEHYVKPGGILQNILELKVYTSMTFDAIGLYIPRQNYLIYLTTVDDYTILLFDIKSNNNYFKYIQTKDAFSFDLFFSVIYKNE